ncbi:MAG: hypothetical protein HYX79_10855 [Chloroflexi bacterium]|nr:hypothetical protein [Chloroflexota bacterium]
MVLPSYRCPHGPCFAKLIQGKKKENALALLDYLFLLDEETLESCHDLHEKLTTLLANSAGEEAAMMAWYDRAVPKIAKWLAETPGTLESLHRCTEHQLCHHGVFKVTEDEQKYIVAYDPCGSAGRIRRKREVGLTRKAYPWTWNKAGVPYHCIHCALQFEIIPIDIRGYPIRITLFDADPWKPCTHLFYKKPELIPEEYFTRVGKVKTIK